MNFFGNFQQGENNLIYVEIVVVLWYILGMKNYGKPNSYKIQHCTLLFTSLHGSHPNFSFQESWQFFRKEKKLQDFKNHKAIKPLISIVTWEMKGFLQPLCICGVKNQKVTYQGWRSFPIWPFIHHLQFETSHFHPNIHLLSLKLKNIHHLNIHIITL